MYIKLDGNIVQQFFVDDDPVFPGLAVEQRVPPAYFASLLKVPDDTIVFEGWIRTENGFEPPQIEAPPAPTIEEQIAALEAKLQALRESQPPAP